VNIPQPLRQEVSTFFSYVPLLIGAPYSGGSAELRMGGRARPLIPGHHLPLLRLHLSVSG